MRQNVQEFGFQSTGAWVSFYTVQVSHQSTGYQKQASLHSNSSEQISLQMKIVFPRDELIVFLCIYKPTSEYALFINEPK